MSTTMPCRIAAAAFIVFGFACSEESSDPAPTPDAGFTSTPDAGEETPDSGVDVDAGFGPCNPVDGTGCPGTDSCVWLPPPNDIRQCRDIGEQLPIGSQCVVVATNCEPGASCVNVGEPTCRQVCVPANGNADCDPLAGAHLCVTLQQSSGDYGFCNPYTPCDPRNDTCADNEVCSILQNGVTGCEPAGSVPNRGDCSANTCQKGLLCVNLGGGGARCYEPCDATQAMPMCNTPNTRCAGLQGVDFGICVDSGTNCNPIDDMCPAGDVCTLIGSGVAECRQAGNVPRGGDCSANRCQRGNVCVSLPVGGPTCVQPCNEMTTCATGQCSQDLDGFDFGVCF